MGRYWCVTLIPSPDLTLSPNTNTNPDLTLTLTLTRNLPGVFALDAAAWGGGDGRYRGQCDVGSSIRQRKPRSVTREGVVL